MRKGLSSGLIGVGAFLTVLGLLALFFMPGKLMKTPLDVDTTTRLAGTAEMGGETFDVKYTSITKADSEKSDGDVVVFNSSSCLVKDIGDVPDCVSSEDPEERLVTASTDTFATDRRTAEAVNDPKYVEASAGEHHGLVNKFPFETEKKTYPYWEGTIGESVDAVYRKTVDIKGLETYLFEVEVPPTPTEISAGYSGNYSATKELYIEPLSGSIVKQVESQTRETFDGDLFAQFDLEFTDAQVKKNVDEANSNRRSLNLVRRVIPIVGLVLGVPMFIGGIFLLLRGRREDGPSHAGA